jgi:histidinol-phosphate aminotransferase
MNLPDKLLTLSPHTPAEGDFRVRLDANESFLELPEEVDAAVRQALAAVDVRRYPSSRADRLRELAGEYYGVPPERIVAGNGSDELIGLILSVTVPRGGRVLLREPDFTMYRFYARLHELDAVTEGPADALIFSNPCNPTGEGLTAVQVESLLGEHNLVIADEAYMEFWGESALSLTGKYENLIILRTLSKAAGLAGLRVGFAIACERVAALLRAAKSPFNLNAASQAAAAAALGFPQYIRDAAAQIVAAREELFRLLSRLPLTVVNTRANFVLIEGAPHLHAALLQKGISIRLLPSGTLRVTAGTPRQHKALTAALRELLPA